MRMRDEVNSTLYFPLLDINNSTKYINICHAMMMALINTTCTRNYKKNQAHQHKCWLKFLCKVKNEYPPITCDMPMIMSSIKVLDMFLSCKECNHTLCHYHVKGEKECIPPPPPPNTHTHTHPSHPLTHPPHPLYPLLCWNGIV